MHDFERTGRHAALARWIRLVSVAALLVGLGACGTTPGGFDPDTQRPTLSLSGVTDGSTVSTSTVTIDAFATDDRGVTSVRYTVGGGPETTCPQSSTSVWTCDVPLATGDNVIVVVARDAAGNATSRRVDVRYEPSSGDPDTQAPTLSLSGVTDGSTVSTSTVTIDAFATDDRGVASVRYTVGSGPETACPQASTSVWTCDVPLTAGDNVIVVIARDAAGNATARQVDVRYEPSSGGSAFSIDLIFFDETFTPTQRQAFETAAARWESIVTADLQDTPIDTTDGEACLGDEPGYTGTVDDLLIYVTSFTTGAGGLLGSAYPCFNRNAGPDAGTNLVGFMEFDTEDLEILESDGDLVEVILHEMGHVLGIGTNWEWAYHDLLDYDPAGTASTCRQASGFDVAPTYTGTHGIQAWTDGLGGVGPLPVEDEGGAGTQCGHWEEDTFGAELMTGFLNGQAFNPLSEMTIRSLEDIGLTVDVTQADPYTLPSGPALQGEALGFDIASAEIIRPPRAGVDPETGEVTVLPAR